LGNAADELAATIDSLSSRAVIGLFFSSGGDVDHKTRNNIKADATHDQAMACIRDGVEIPDDMDLRASAARLPLDSVPESMRDVVADLQRMWAEEANVDMVD
jgi:hypothetical protein